MERRFGELLTSNFGKSVKLHGEGRGCSGTELSSEMNHNPTSPSLPGL